MSLPSKAEESRSIIPEPLARPFRAHWWLTPVLVLALGKLTFWAQVASASTTTFLNGGLGYHYKYLDSLFWSSFMTWDSHWYWSIAEEGYPSSLPESPNGQLTHNEWAFYPGWPLLVRAGMALTGGSFPLLALILGTGLSFVAVLMLYRYLETRGSRLLALTATVVLAFTPIGIGLHLAYAEALALALLMGILFALGRERWGLMIVLILALSLTRPIALPLAAVLGVLALVELHHHGRAALRRARTWWLGGLAVLAAASFSFWPLIAALGTDRPDAFLATQGVWRSDSLGSWATVIFGGGEGLITVYRWLALALIVLAYCAFLYPTAKRRMPVEVQLWAFFYVTYLVAALDAGGIDYINASVPRYLLLALLPVLPLVVAVERAPARWRRPLALSTLAAIVAVGVLSNQWMIIYTVLESPIRMIPL